jgi:hypothetical protein
MVHGFVRFGRNEFYEIPYLLLGGVEYNHGATMPTLYTEGKNVRYHLCFEQICMLQRQLSLYY